MTAKPGSVEPRVPSPDGIRATAPKIFVRLSSAVPSEAYATYWRFAAERQAIFFDRVGHQPPPWTSDPILSRFRFTNVYRASDRVSQFLIRRVIYSGSTESREQFFRIVLFKLFNRIDTWRLLEGALGSISWAGYSFEEYDRILGAAFAGGRRIYSAAYIIPTASGFGYERKHQNHLRLLEHMMAADAPERLQECRGMREAFLLLRSFPSIGDFLAYQLVTDLNYGTLTDFSESEFTVPGPGAHDGVRKCFSDLGDLSASDVIKLMAERQAEEFGRFGLEFRDLWGRPLQYIDCQNLFCEVGKYARVAHPNIKGVSGRTRIKQRFREGGLVPFPWYPPKWGLNGTVQTSLGGV